MTNLEKICYRELYKKSLYDFVKDFWNCADPSKLVDGVLIQYYCEVFQYMCREWVGYKEVEINIPDEYKDYEIIDIRQNKNNLCLNVPPRHSKSMIFNVMGPVWLWLSNPVKAASISHTFDLAKDMNSKRQLLINSDKFKFFFGDEFKLVTNTVDTLKDNRGGELYSKNRDSMTGYGADIIINDDLTNAEAARKDKQEMNNAWNYYQNTMPSRINNINKCIIFNVQQRLAPNDITGHILNNKDLKKSYVFIVLPAIFEKNTLVICPISGDILVFNKGDTLWPERFGNYDALKFQVGDGIFQTQYLQKPIASDRTIIKESMIYIKDVVDVPNINQADMIYASHDFPVKDKETSDFLGSVLAYKVGSTIYIKDCLEKRMAFVKSIEYAKNLDLAYPGIIQIVEDKANGSPIIQQLRDQVAGVQPFQPGTQSKMQRLESASVYLNAGNIVFIRDKYDNETLKYVLSDGLNQLIMKLTNFPFVEHDDIVDAFSQLILYIFMDKRYQVYGKSFNEYNIIPYTVNQNEYKTVFFNKDGDTWKICEIAIVYGIESRIVVKRECLYKGTIDGALIKLKEFAPDTNVFIDASNGEALYGIYSEGISIERYSVDDFEKSVANLNLAFGKKNVLISDTCKLVRADIEAFKYDKRKDDIMQFKTNEDGFVACIRIAMKYYGIY